VRNLTLGMVDLLDQAQLEALNRSIPAAEGVLRSYPPGRTASAQYRLPDL
jgi:hypothetical protein